MISSAYASLYTYATNSNASSTYTIPVGGNVIFNQPTDPDTSPFLTTGITYNSATGVITIAQPGDYLLNWGVSLKASGGRMGIALNGVLVNGTTSRNGAGNTMTSTSAVLHITTPNSTISLTNFDTATLQLQAGSAAAFIDSDTAYMTILRLHDLPTP